MGHWLIGASFLFSSLVSAADNSVVSKWTGPIRVDGSDLEWASDPINSEKSVDVNYAFRNDDRNLYVLFIFKDPKFLSSIELTGITLYLGPEGKKQKDYGVRFLKKTVNADEIIAIMEKQGPPLTEERKTEIKAKPMYIAFEAAAVNKKGEVIPPSAKTADSDNPAFRVVRQESQMVYEFRVPLASREVHPAGIGSGPGKAIKVGFEWGGLTKEMKDAIMSQLGSEGARASNREAPGMSSEDVGGERSEADYEGSSPSLTAMRNQAKRFPKLSFWVDVKLAQAQTQ
jgi:hypothetical protein